MKNLIKIYIGIAIFIGFLYAEKGYRIEVVVDTVQKVPYVKIEKRVVILSSDDKIVKEYILDEFASRSAGAIISRKGNLILNTEILPKQYLSEKYRDRYIVRGEGGYSGVAPYRLQFINQKGEVVKEKIYEVYFDEYAKCIERGISEDGSVIFFKYWDPPAPPEWEENIHLIVFDSLGNEIVHISDNLRKLPLGFLKISPDGKIIGAEMGKKLFFLDVQTKRIKIVKAEGEGWRAQFSLPPEGATPLGKIRISWGIYAEPQNKKWIKGGHTYLTFDELPEDLSTLFKQGGEK